MKERQPPPPAAMWVRGGSQWMGEIDEEHQGERRSACLTVVQPKPLPLHLFRGPPPEQHRLALFK